VAPTSDDVARAAARLRQRFSALKKTIRERARARGLMAVGREPDAGG
jgi:hypothetical protein